MIGPSRPPTGPTVAGPAVGPAPGPAGRSPAATASPPREHRRGVAAEAPTVGRRAVIGPVPRPSVGVGVNIAFTEVYEAKVAAGKADDKKAKNEDAVDVTAVADCRRGELPPSGWSTRWNAPTRQAALLAAVEAAQMHVVYAMQPRSELWQNSVGAPGLQQPDLDRLLKLHLSGKLKAAKGKAQEVIAWLLEEGASLETLCADGDFEVRTAATTALAGLGEEVGGARAAALLKSECWQRRASGAEVLGKLGKGAAAHGAALAALLGDTEPVVRMAATAALSRLGAEAAPHIASALRSDKPRTREAAAEALGQLGPVAAAPHAAALAALLEDGDWQVPTAAASALKRIGADAVPHCVDMLTRCNPVARSAVVEALARLGGPEVADSVAPLLDHAEPSIRRHAAECLGRLGPDAASQHTAAVARLQSDADKEVRKSAREAWLRLGPRGRQPEVHGSGDALPPMPAGGKAKGGKGGGKGHHGSAGDRDRRGGRSRSPRR